MGGTSDGQKDGDKPEALPAVTVPPVSLMKQGRSLDMLSMLLPCRGNSSTFTSLVPEREGFPSEPSAKIPSQARALRSPLTFSGRHCDRGDLLVKMAGFLRRLCSVLGLDGIQILLLSADAPLLCHILG